MTVQTLRGQILTQRRQLSPFEQTHAAQRVAQQFASHPLFHRSQHIAFYLANDGELDPTPLLQLAWQQKKTCYLPVLHPLSLNRLWFMSYASGDKLYPNRYGILEPPIHAQRLFPAWALQLVLTPLVAFDTQGHRLGMGGGFYDRTFAFLKYHRHRSHPYLVGLAYEFQKINHLTPNPWDVSLQGIVTENQMYFP
ncbi:MAG: 5-formyltetrahydrofolate cyclo-ligase [Gammaproteobacteria bacterium]